MTEMNYFQFFSPKSRGRKKKLLQALTACIINSLTTKVNILCLTEVMDRKTLCEQHKF